MRNGQEQEGNVKEEEQGEESNSRLEGQHEQDSGEEEPTKQEETNHVVQVGRIGVRFSNAKGLGLESTPSEPESTIRRQSGSTKGVLNDNFPHTGQELNETTVKVSKTNDTRRV